MPATDKTIQEMRLCVVPRGLGEWEELAIPGTGFVVMSNVDVTAEFGITVPFENLGDFARLQTTLNVVGGVINWDVFARRIERVP